MTFLKGLSQSQHLQKSCFGRVLFFCTLCGYFGTLLWKSWQRATVGDYHWCLDLSNVQCGSSHVLNRILTLNYTENNFVFTKIWVLYLAVVFSSQLSQVFEEKNALSLQLRGNSRNICESHQHYNEVLNRCLVLERQLQELQSADKGMVRVVVLVQWRGKLIAGGSTWLCSIVATFCPLRSVLSAIHSCFLSGVVCNRCCSRSTPRKEWASERQLHTRTAGVAAEVKKARENRGGDVSRDGGLWAGDEPISVTLCQSVGKTQFHTRTLWKWRNCYMHLTAVVSYLFG